MLLEAGGRASALVWSQQHRAEPGTAAGAPSSVHAQIILLIQTLVYFIQPIPGDESAHI